MQVTVTAAIAPLYRVPDATAERVDELLCGMTAECLERHDAYALLRTDYHYEGYAPVDCLSEAPCAHKTQVQVCAPFLDALAQPRIQSTCLLTLPRGARLSIAAPEQDGWQALLLPDGRQAFARASQLCALPASWLEQEERKLRAAIADSACTYLGTPYRWGGKTPQGIDCSGLVSMAYLLNGVHIHRDASLHEGFPLVSVARTQLDVGDLLFFCGHVALYLGGGRYIHATGRAGDDGVVINSLEPSDPLYRHDLAESIKQIGSLYPQNL